MAGLWEEGEEDEERSVLKGDLSWRVPPSPPPPPRPLLVGEFVVALCSSMVKTGLSILLAEIFRFLTSREAVEEVRPLLLPPPPASWCVLLFA